MQCIPMYMSFSRTHDIFSLSSSYVIDLFNTYSKEKATILCSSFITHLVITQIWIDNIHVVAPKCFYNKILRKN